MIFDPEPKEVDHAPIFEFDKHSLADRPDYIDSLGGIHVLRGFLTADECAAIIKFGNEQTNTEVTSGRYRTIFSSATLAEFVCSRLHDISRDTSRYDILRVIGRPDNDTWLLDNVNDTWRFVANKTGSKFPLHLDSTYVKSINNCSIYTVLIYLNDDYEGGELCTSKIKFKASAGDLVLLDQTLCHEALAITAGEKYLVRSELMYTRKTPIESTTDKTAMNLYSRALAECASDLALEAFKISPRLENLVYNI